MRRLRANKAAIFYRKTPDQQSWNQGVHLLTQHGQPLPAAHLGAIAGLDRHAERIEVPCVEYEKLSDDRLGEPSAAIRQRARFEGTRLLTNADMGPAEVRDFCWLDDAGGSLLRAAMKQLHMSSRAYHRVLKLARTIADLTGIDEIQTAHLAEAIQSLRNPIHCGEEGHAGRRLGHESTKEIGALHRSASLES